MVWIAPGSFTLGNRRGEPEEKPETQVTLTQGYWLGKYPVTKRQFGGGRFGKETDDDCPAADLNWEWAVEFCRALTNRENAAGRLPEGYAYVLPTEAEWEYACRAGTTDDFAGNLGELAWYRANSRREIHPVGQKQPNAWGLYDMHGNVLEWCWDWYDDYPGGHVFDPMGPSTGYARVARGGNYLWRAEDCRSTRRSYWETNEYGSGLGFRVALAPQTRLRPETKAESPVGLATAGAPDNPITGTNLEILELGIRMLWIERGTVTTDDVVAESTGETPSRVSLPQSYWLSVSPVSIEQWVALMGTDSLAQPGIDHLSVAWLHAMDFCRKLTNKEKAAGRLPIGYTFTLPTTDQEKNASNLEGKEGWNLNTEYHRGDEWCEPPLEWLHKHFRVALVPQIKTDQHIKYALRGVFEERDEWIFGFDP